MHSHIKQTKTVREYVLLCASVNQPLVLPAVLYVDTKF